jgi:hypothetical protein
MLCIKRFFMGGLILGMFTFSLCKKDKYDPQLPPETTTGAMTFGCKVNGEVFVPRDGDGRPGLFVEYAYLGSGSGGGWFLNIPAVDYRSSLKRNINISTDSLLLTEGMIYEFKTTKGNARAFYTETASWGLNIFPKIDSETGSLHIKKFDQTNRVLAGTFFFVGTNSQGQKVNITEGRFDIRY